MKSKCSSKTSTMPTACSCSATARPSGRRNGNGSSAKHKEGDVVSGAVPKKIKGGLLVNIGVNVFLPASQVDIRRPPDIGDYIGQDVRVQDPQDRRSSPQHRRQPPQADRRSTHREEEEAAREIAPGQIRKGIVKNIAEFGAFVDLGGIDGLLHITDMGWDRVTTRTTW